MIYLILIWSYSFLLNGVITEDVFVYSEKDEEDWTDESKHIEVDSSRIMKMKYWWKGRETAKRMNTKIVRGTIIIK